MVIKPNIAMNVSCSTSPVIPIQALDWWPEIAWMWDARTGELCFNKAGRESLGSRHGQPGTLEKVWQPYVDAGDMEAFRTACIQGVTTGSAWEVEVRLHGLKSKGRWHLLKVTPHEAGADALTGIWLGSCVEIHELKERVNLPPVPVPAQAGDDAANERYHRATMWGGVGIWELKIADLDLYLAPELKAMLGYLEHELPAHLDGWNALVHPDDLLRIEQAVADHLAGKTPHYESELRRRHKDGRYLWFLSRGTAIRDAKGNAVQFVGADVDITERKAAQELCRKSEEMLRAVVETTPECVKVVNEDGVVLYMNEAGLGLVGATGEMEVIGQSVYPLIASEHQDEWQSCHRRVCRGETLSWQFEIVNRAGRRIWMETHAAPFVLPDLTLGQLAVTRDITLRHQVEEQRELLLVAERAAKEKAEEAGRIKDDFLATLSHELRTPLNAIVGWSQILREDDVTHQDIVEGLDVIDRNARAQAKMIEDLLDMSRITSGKIRLDLQEVDVLKLAEAVLQTLRPAAQAKGVRLRPLRTGGPLPRIQADAARLQQVFGNLVNNAIKFTPAGGVVAMSLRETPQGLEVSVTDSGQGIDPALLGVIFERFRQADGSTTRRYSGLGLGLSIARHLVEMHGGMLTVASEGLGHGASFYFVLPVPVASEGVEEAFATPSTEAFASSSLLCEEVLPHDALPDLSHMHILIVDDELDARVLVKRMLENCGAKVTMASSVEEALRALREKHPSLLVSDIGMPDKDGYNLIHSVRSLVEPDLRSMPTIALTAFARHEDRDRALASGFDCHLCKPVRQRELTDTIARLMVTSLRSV